MGTEGLECMFESQNLIKIALNIAKQLCECNIVIKLNGHSRIFPEISEAIIRQKRPKLRTFITNETDEQDFYGVHYLCFANYYITNSFKYKIWYKMAW